MTEHYFSNMIATLRRQEEVILYHNYYSFSETDATELIDFLTLEYQNEALDFPHTAPAFDPDAARWGAQTVYFAAQLILYRKNEAEEIPDLLPDYPGPTTAGAMLSVDLCLRFLPDMILPLKKINKEDELIRILELKLTKWHYSGLTYELPVEALDFDVVCGSPCLHQLYVNRIIRLKKMALAKHPANKALVQASLGMYAQEFWKELTFEMNDHE